MYENAIVVGNEFYETAAGKCFLEMEKKYGIKVHFLCLDRWIYSKHDFSYEDYEHRDRSYYTYMKAFLPIIFYLKKNCKKDTIFIFTETYIGKKTYLLQLLIMLMGGGILSEKQ